MPLKLQEIKEMSLNDLKDSLNKSKLDLAGFRMKIASRQLEDSSQVKKTRKDIARINTILTQKINSGEKFAPQVIEKKEKVKKQIKEIKKETKEPLSEKKDKKITKETKEKKLVKKEIKAKKEKK